MHQYNIVSFDTDKETAGNMLQVIIIFIIVDIIVSLIYVKVPFFSLRYLAFRPGTVKRWEEKSYIRRFCECFFPALAVFLVCFSIGYYHEINSPTGYEQMLIDGEARYLAVFGEDYDGDADVAFEIKQGYSSGEICKIISDICREDYIRKGSDNLNVYAEGEEYVIMDGNVNIGKVITVDRKFGVVLRFYWN